jgi:hypothetical protein
VSSKSKLLIERSACGEVSKFRARQALMLHHALQLTSHHAPDFSFHNYAVR